MEVVRMWEVPVFTTPMDFVELICRYSGTELMFCV